MTDSEAWHSATRGRPASRGSTRDERIAWADEHFDAYLNWQDLWVGDGVWIVNATSHLGIDKSAVCELLAKRGLRHADTC